MTISDLRLSAERRLSALVHRLGFKYPCRGCDLLGYSPHEWHDHSAYTAAVEAHNGPDKVPHELCSGGLY